MTELTTYQAPTPAGLPVMQGDAVDLEAWARKLAAANRIGTALACTSFVPKHFQGNPDDATAAIIRGAELGFSPTQALEMFYVVHGRAGMYARTMVAIAMRLGHKIEDHEVTATSVTVRAKRKGEKDWQYFTWDIERASQAGYLTNPKYKSNPIEMFRAKGQAEAVRTIAPDALTGLGIYSVEEIELDDLGEKQVPAPVAAALEPAADAITEQEWAELHAEATAAGIAKPAAFIQGILGRRLPSWQAIKASEIPAIREAIAEYAATAPTITEEA